MPDKQEPPKWMKDRFTEEEIEATRCPKCGTFTCIQEWNCADPYGL